MLRRILIVVLGIVLCLPGTSLAVLYTCTMDGLTRMADCEGHPPAAKRPSVAQRAGHECEPVEAVPEGCCETRIVKASLERPAAFEMPEPSIVARAVAWPDLAVRTAAVRTRVFDLAPACGPPLYHRHASLLI